MVRLLIHVPVGLAIAVLAIFNKAIAAILAVFFLAYEFNQDKYKKDHAHKDIIGAAWGVAIGGIGIILYRRHKKRLLAIKNRVPDQEKASALQP